MEEDHHKRLNQIPEISNDVLSQEYFVKERPPCDQRQWPRNIISMQTQLGFKETIWVGISTNMSVGGLRMVFKGLIFALEGQSIQLAFVTETSIVEITGVVRRFHTAVSAPNNDEGRVVSSLAVQFSPMDEVTLQKLTNVLDQLRQHASCVNVLGRLLPFI